LLPQSKKQGVKLKEGERFLNAFDRISVLLLGVPLTEANLQDAASFARLLDGL
jgi:hypothetical protein